MKPKKQNRGGDHAARVANRGSDRVQEFLRNARGGGAGINADGFARMWSSAIADVIDLWGTFLGFGSSFQVGVADLGDQPLGTWQGGVTTIVRVQDQIPEDATFPADTTLNAGALKLRTVDGGVVVDLQLTGVDRLDDGYQLRVSVKDLSPQPNPPNPPVAGTDYFGNLYYTTTNDPTPVLAALIRGHVT
jgi:hypothetical protein